MFDLRSSQATTARFAGLCSDWELSTTFRLPPEMNTENDCIYDLRSSLNFASVTRWASGCLLCRGLLINSH